MMTEVTKRRGSAVLFFMVVTLLLTVRIGGAKEEKVKNVIFMIPDGMGISHVTSARIFKNGPNGDRLALETLPHIGYQSTHSKDSTVTDSAAAASAWASGEKFNNGEISCHDDDADGVCDPGTMVPTLLDIAKSKGRATGLIATSDITHATPAAFGANVHNRKCEEEIIRQYIDRGITVLLGGGIAGNRSSCLLAHSAPDFLDAVLKHARSDGYTVVQTESDMDAAVSKGMDRILGVFGSGGKSKELFRVDPSTAYPDDEPTLPEMTRAALAVLERDPDGFFCVVEGSQIDWAGHANDIHYLLAEMLAFDEAVKTVLDWIAVEPQRRIHTLLIVVADHETGGHMVDGPYGTLSKAGEVIEDGWTSTNHSAQDTIIWSQGPGSWRLNRALDNTDVYDIIRDVL